MESRRLPDDGGARTRRWHSRRRRGDGKRARRSVDFAIPAMPVAGIVMLVLSCGDGAVEPPAPPPAPVATTVTVSPGSATLTAPGGTARFTAEVRDQNGQVMTGVFVAWSSSDTLVVRVDVAGLAKGVAEGTATITAAVGEVSGTAEITTVVNPDLAALSGRG